mgnify:CR=1 FL=1
MKRLKVMTIVGTRPEIIKLSRVIAELDQHVDHVLVHSGQNYDYELNQVFFDQLQIRPPDRFLNAVGETPAETIGKVIALSDVAMAEAAIGSGLSTLIFLYAIRRTGGGEGAAR